MTRFKLEYRTAGNIIESPGTYDTETEAEEQAERYEALISRYTRRNRKIRRINGGED